MVILDRNEKAARDAFNTSIDGGLTFIDTAEVYGSGVSTYLIEFSSMRVNKFSSLVPVSIAQLAGTCIIICRGQSSNPEHPTYSP